MYNLNMWGANTWWGQQQKKKAEEAQVYKPPSKCTFCNTKIDDGDWFYAGYDRYRIYAETCENIRCYQWLEHKVRKKRIDDKTIR